MAHSEDRDEGASELRPKQQRVQNALYMNDEDEEEDGEALEGRKVVVSDFCLHQQTFKQGQSVSSVRGRRGVMLNYS